MPDYGMPNEKSQKQHDYEVQRDENYLKILGNIFVELEKIANSLSQINEKVVKTSKK